MEGHSDISVAKILRIGGPSKSRDINKEAIKIVQIKTWKVWIWNMEEVEYALKVKSSELFNRLSKGCEGKKDLRVTPKFLFWLTQSVVVQWGTVRWGSWDQETQEVEQVH